MAARFGATALCVGVGGAGALAGCTQDGTQDGDFAPGPPRGDWAALELLQTEGKLGGCAAGDVYPERPGDEAVAVSSEGAVLLASRGATGWEVETLLEAPGELIQVAVGDLLPDAPGAEILAGGMAAGAEDDGGPGALYLLFREQGGWRSQRLAEPAGLVHAVVIADLLPDVPGLEAASAGFDMGVTLFDLNAWPEVQQRRIADLPAPAKGMAAFDGALVVACAEGTLQGVWPLQPGELDVLGYTQQQNDVFAGLWRSTPVARGSSGLARAAAGAGRCLVSSNDGTLYLGLSVRDRFELEPIFQEPEGAEGGGVKGRGAVVAELDPARDGLELATAGYSGRVHLAYPLPEPSADGSGWGALEVYDDGSPLHHLAAGDLLPEVPGLELLCGGYAGRLVLLSAESD